MPDQSDRRRGALATRPTILLGVVAGLGVLVMGIYVSRALETQAVTRLQETLASPGEPASRCVRAPRRRVARRAGPPGARPALRAGCRGAGDRDRRRRRGPRGVRSRDRPRDGEPRRPSRGPRLAGGVGRDVRRSASLGRDLLYVAVPSSARAAGGRSSGWRSRRTRRRGARPGAPDRPRRGAPGHRRGGRDRAVREPAGDPARSGGWRPPRGAWPRATSRGRCRSSGSDEIAALGVALDRPPSRSGEDRGLDDEQAKVRTILDGMTEGVVALDDRGRLLLLNPAARLCSAWRARARGPVLPRGDAAEGPPRSGGRGPGHG